MAGGTVEAMTTAAYDYLGSSWSFEPGSDADVIFVDADPRDDLSTLTRPRLVIRQGEVLSQP